MPVVRRNSEFTMSNVFPHRVPHPISQSQYYGGNQNYGGAFNAPQGCHHPEQPEADGADHQLATIPPKGPPPPESQLGMKAPFAKSIMPRHKQRAGPQ